MPDRVIEIDLIPKGLHVYSGYTLVFVMHVRPSYGYTVGSLVAL